MSEINIQDESKLLDYLGSLCHEDSIDHLPELIKGLEECALMPNQMLWVTHYNPLSFVYKKNVQKLTGYDSDEFDVRKSLEIVHPDDYTFVNNTVKESMELFARMGEDKKYYLTTLEYRIKHFAGHIIKIQRISYPLKLGESGHPLTELNISNDITYIKTSNEPRLVIHNPRSREQIYFASKNTDREFGLSKREIQILQSLADGKTSDMIGSELFISKHTVDVHRRKMLEKTRKGNTAELITFGYRSGIIN